LRPHGNLAGRRALPLHLARQHLEREPRLGENLRHVERRVLRREVQRPFRFARVDAARESRESGHGAPRVDRQSFEAGLQVEGARVRQLAPPVEARIEEVAVRRELREQLAQVRRERQELGEARERLELEQIGVDEPPRRSSIDGRLERDLEARRVHLGALARHERELARAEFVAALGLAAMQAPAYEATSSTGTSFCEPPDDARQREVGGRAPHLAADQRSPHAHRAVAARHVDRVVEPRAPAGEVGRAELGEHAPAPGLDLAHRCAGELGAHFERGAERSGRPRRQPN
jgi:hypothetical protein